MTLRDVQAEYAERLQVRWLSFLLHPQPDPERRWTDHHSESWSRAGDFAPQIRFALREPGTPLPAWGLPALAAAKCAEGQGPEAFERYHLALLRAYFEEGRDIADPKVLAALARKCGLDMRRFRRDLKSDATRAQVVTEHQAAQRQLGVTSVPTTIFSDERGNVRIVGAAAIDQYRRVIDWLLST
ncbi:MAG: DsbA family protein [Chloroflexi bacterium]|nr:DsbA family protein [Chloroflexota bacterium]